jgi:hypothetical protein
MRNRLFYIEGALTMFFAVVAVFFLPDFPSTSKFLSPLERRLAEVRMAEDVGETDSESGGHLSGLILAVTDWKVGTARLFLWGGRNDLSAGMVDGSCIDRHGHRFSVRIHSGDPSLQAGLTFLRRFNQYFPSEGL